MHPNEAGIAVVLSDRTPCWVVQLCWLAAGCAEQLRQELRSSHVVSIWRRIRRCRCFDCGSVTVAPAVHLHMLFIYWILSSCAAVPAALQAIAVWQLAAVRALPPAIHTLLQQQAALVCHGLLVYGPGACA